MTFRSIRSRLPQASLINMPEPCQIDFGDFMQISGASTHLVSCMGWFVNSYSDVCEWRASLSLGRGP